MRRIAGFVVVVVLALGLAAPAVEAQPEPFRAVLSGADEVPVRDTDARGVATFLLSADGTSLDFRLVVANIENVVAAHIHCIVASDGTGPVGVTLFTGPAAGGPFNGILAMGPITAPDAGNGCGWADLDAVIAALETGDAYVNVHTNDGVAPPNTGAGDFPGGEIRGVIF
jgi:hypothetical protein